MNLNPFALFRSTHNVRATAAPAPANPPPATARFGLAPSKAAPAEPNQPAPELPGPDAEADTASPPAVTPTLAEIPGDNLAEYFAQRDARERKQAEDVRAKIREHNQKVVAADLAARRNRDAVDAEVRRLAYERVLPPEPIADLWKAKFERLVPPGFQFWISPAYVQGLIADTGIAGELRGDLAKLRKLVDEYCLLEKKRHDLNPNAAVLMFRAKFEEQRKAAVAGKEIREDLPDVDALQKQFSHQRLLIRERVRVLGEEAAPIVRRIAAKLQEAARKFAVTLEAAEHKAAQESAVPLNPSGKLIAAVIAGLRFEEEGRHVSIFTASDREQFCWGLLSE